MALAVGKLPHVHQLDLTCMSQQQVEARAEGFQLLGLIVVANQVRQDSKNAVIQLQHRHVFALFTDRLLRSSFHCSLMSHMMTWYVSWLLSVLMQHHILPYRVWRCLASKLL